MTYIIIYVIYIYYIIYQIKETAGKNLVPIIVMYLSTLIK